MCQKNGLAVPAVASSARAGMPMQKAPPFSRQGRHHELDRVSLPGQNLGGAIEEERVLRHWVERGARPVALNQGLVAEVEAQANGETGIFTHVIVSFRGEAVVISICR